MLFVSEEDLKEATNMLALASTESGVRMLSYAIMSNHLHSILAASKPCCEAYGDNLRKRLGQFLRSAGKKLPPIGFHAVEIESLKQLRDEIAYVIRKSIRRFASWTA